MAVSSLVQVCPARQSGCASNQRWMLLPYGDGSPPSCPSKLLAMQALRVGALRQASKQASLSAKVLRKPASRRRQARRAWTNSTGSMTNQARRGTSRFACCELRAAGSVERPRGIPSIPLSDAILSCSRRKMSQLFCWCLLLSVCARH